MVRNSIFSLAPILMLPVENWRWFAHMRIVSGVKKDKAKEVGCVLLVGDILPP